MKTNWTIGHSTTSLLSQLVSNKNLERILSQTILADSSVHLWIYYLLNNKATPTIFEYTLPNRTQSGERKPLNVAGWSAAGYHRQTCDWWSRPWSLRWPDFCKRQTFPAGPAIGSDCWSPSCASRTDSPRWIALALFRIGKRKTRFLTKQCPTDIVSRNARTFSLRTSQAIEFSIVIFHFWIRTLILNRNGNAN